MGDENEEGHPAMKRTEERHRGRRKGIAKKKGAKCTKGTHYSNERKRGSGGNLRTSEVRCRQKGEL